MAIKQRPDSPTNNFCTLNPLDMANSPTISDGNLSYIHTTANLWATCRGSLGFNSGRYYWEGRASGSSASLFGYCDNFNIYANGGDTNPTSTTSNLCVSWYGSVSQFNTETGTSYPWSGGGFGNTDVVMICVDYDLGYVWLGKNGTWVLSGDPDNNSNYVHTFSNSEKITIYPFASASNNTGFYFNFGQDPTFGGTKTPSGGTNSDGSYPDKSDTGIGGFFYDPPAGAKALCSANLPEMTPTVDDDTPQDYFKAVTYTGNGTSQSITGVGFQSDLVWIKSRSGTNGNASHALYDSVRGVGANKELTPDQSYAEGDGNSSQFGYVSTLDVDGFSIGAGSASSIQINGSSTNYVAWCMKAGGAPTADNSNTSGAMTANSVSLNGTLQSNYTPAGSPTIYPKRMSINTDAGFSIVKWTGNGAALVDNTYQSIPTGLSGQLAFAIQKRTDTTGNWHTYHKNCSVAHTYWSAHTYLNSTLDEQIGSGYDSQVFKYTHSNGLCEFQNGDGNNVSSGEYISYFFEEVEGYSKFGSYTGNGSADGPFIYCGFRPAWIMIKQSSSSGVENAWWITDSTRYEFNGDTSDALRANTADEENTSNSALMPDYLSNGFKIRGTDTAVNLSASTYIFMAFAEQPFNYANAR